MRSEYRIRGPNRRLPLAGLGNAWGADVCSTWAAVPEPLMDMITNETRTAPVFSAIFSVTMALKSIGLYIRQRISLSGCGADATRFG
jgi:hypothetical protein